MRDSAVPETNQDVFKKACLLFYRFAICWKTTFVSVESPLK